ncbi:MAG: hypothetical protein WBG32_06670 [Nodosilinea sp.]
MAVSAVQLGRLDYTLLHHISHGLGGAARTAQTVAQTAQLVPLYY